jgi:hypothetical protein
MCRNTRKGIFPFFGGNKTHAGPAQLYFRPVWFATKVATPKVRQPQIS